ncbi:hypothetical protein [Rubritalea sp.]|uniref:hypothetical protein n=1 Tax=Rubritalea sp. TaxID=2109375 RepID=UPI003EF15758
MTEVLQTSQRLLTTNSERALVALGLESLNLFKVAAFGVVGGILKYERSLEDFQLGGVVVAMAEAFSLCVMEADVHLAKI